jgi:excisionase family DNA binding protein
MTVAERWVDVQEVAGHLGVTKDSIYRWVDKKGFPAHRAGRLFRFKLSEVDEWVRNGAATQRDGTRAERIGEGTI